MKAHHRNISSQFERQRVQLIRRVAFVESIELVVGYVRFRKRFEGNAELISVGRVVRWF